MPPSESVEHIAHSALVRLLQPHIQDILELVKASLLDENHGDPVYGLAYGIVGDLAEIFGAQIKPLLLQDWVAAELKSRRCPPENKQTMRWAREVGQFETICAPLNDFHAYLDGQTCHRVSIVLCFFFPPTSQGLSLPLTTLTLLVQRSQSRTFFPPWVRYTFHVCFVCRQSSFRWCLLFHPFITFGLHPPYIPYSFSSCYFWFESPLSIITVSFESQSSPPLHCYIMQSFLFANPLQRTAVSLIVSSSHTLATPRHSGVVPIYWHIPVPPSNEFQILSYSLCRQFFPRILPRYLRFAHRPLLVISSKSRQNGKVSRSLLERAHHKSESERTISICLLNLLFALP